MNKHRNQAVPKLLYKPADVGRTPESSQGTVGGSKIDTNRSLLGHDELSSKNGKRMRLLRD